MEYESDILKRLIKTYGVVGNPRYISEIIKEFIVRGKERFPELFTYQADWLAHIDEFGLNPSYTVSYTGQSIYAPNTLERPVKSAILTGQTLVNLANYSDATININSKYVQIGSLVYSVIGKPITLFNFTDKVISFQLIANGSFKQTVSINANSKTVITLSDGEEIKNIRGTQANGWTIDETSLNKLKMGLMVIEGDYTNVDIPYFEGMQSVKMPVLTTTGKNLFDGKLEMGSIDNATGLDKSSSTRMRSNYIKVKPSTTYTLSSNESTYHLYVSEYDANKSFIKYISNKNNIAFTTNSTTNYIRFRTDDNETDFNIEIQLEDSSIKTSYEPYKTNILTVNEDVVLRAVGDVKDELDLLTGELTQRIEEIVLDGSEAWKNFGDETSTTWRTSFRLETAKKSSLCICDRFIYSRGATEEKQKIYITTTPNLSITLKKEQFPTLNDFKTWLSQTKPKVQYELATPIVKTVGLTILDQNGQNVKQLMSFNGGTHFNTGSLEGSPLPSVTVTVETDLEETLRVCSLDGNTM